MSVNNLYILIIFLPFYSAFIVGFFGRLIGRRGSIFVSVGNLIVAAALSWFNLIGDKLFVGTVSIDFGLWCFSISNIQWNFIIDSMTGVMLVVVTTISLFVHLYSVSYMRYDPHVIRFFSYLSLFTFFMLMLVSSSNLMMLFIGWEGVGLCSYLLVNFWFTRLQANKAALKAVIVNRIGDVCIILGAGLVFLNANSLDFSVVSAQVSWMQNNGLIVLSNLMLLVASVGKSAQIGLHMWLPDAMEGPTPVSALIHAATMVTAGVFLLLRLSLWYSLSIVILNLTVVVGGLTAIFAGTVGLLQNDIKKVIAYSTCSQLGYMMLACGCTAFNLSLFHLFNHAFFKALLFLSAGSIIHALSDQQDMRKYGGLFYQLPVQYISVLIGSLALIGTPYLTGFYSKDLIPEVLLAGGGSISFWGFILSLIASLLTAGYSMKVIYWTFFASTYQGLKKTLFSVHRITFLETLTLFVLSCFSIFIGYVMRDHFVGLGSDYLLPALNYSNLYSDSEFLLIFYKVLILVILIVGVALGYAAVIFWPGIYYNALIWKKWFIICYYSRFLICKWYFDMIVNQYLAWVILDFGYKSFWVWDKWILEQGRFVYLKTKA